MSEALFLYSLTAVDVLFLKSARVKLSEQEEIRTTYCSKKRKHASPAGAHAERLMKLKFKPHPQAEERKRSALALIKHLLAAKDSPGVLPNHLREPLDVGLWKLTEAEGGKYNTRFRSQGALNCIDKKRQHDHVFQRAKMVTALEKAMEKATPDKIDQILTKAVGCVVTVEEHKRLEKFDKKCDGWERYQKAGILVIDTLTGKRKTC